MLYNRKKQPEKPGVGHWIRTLLLVAITAGVTWYSQSDRNNPFTSRYIIEVGTRGGIPYIACVKDQIPSTAELLFVPNNISAWNSSSPPPFDSARVLITQARNRSLPKSLRIQDWLIPSCNDSAGRLVASDKTQKPRVSPVPQDFGRSRVRPVSIEGDSGCALVISFDQMQLLYIDSSIAVSSEHQRDALRETFDIIVTNGSHAHTRRLRNTLRPLEIVSIGPRQTGSARNSRTDNISYARVNNGMVQYHMDSREQLRVDRIIPLTTTSSGDSSGFSDTTPTK